MQCTCAVYMHAQYMYMYMQSDSPLSFVTEALITFEDLVGRLTHCMNDKPITKFDKIDH